MEFQFKKNYTVNDLVEIVKILRSPEGCPWDKVQTHETIRQDFIEEVYEAVEAIDEKDTEHLKEELGDVLLQVVFHSVLEEEKGNFCLDDAANDVCQKMILRHPHVFGNVKADTPEEVLKNWDAIKMESKSQTTAGEAMESVSKALPALMRSEKLHKRAERGGLQTGSAEEMIDSISEQLADLKKAISESGTEEYGQQIGDILFAVTGLSRALHTDSEKSLYYACDRFVDKFKQLEEKAKQSGIDIQNISSEQVTELWRNEKQT